MVPYVQDPQINLRYFTKNQLRQMLAFALDGGFALYNIHQIRFGTRQKQYTAAIYADSFDRLRSLAEYYYISDEFVLPGLMVRYAQSSDPYKRPRILLYEDDLPRIVEECEQKTNYQRQAITDIMRFRRERLPPLCRECGGRTYRGFCGIETCILHLRKVYQSSDQKAIRSAFLSCPGVPRARG